MVIGCKIIGVMNFVVFEFGIICGDYCIEVSRYVYSFEYGYEIL